MDISNYTPDVSGWFERNKVKLAGFAAGVVLPIVVTALVTVTYRGYGLGEDVPQITPVYTMF